MVQSEDVFENLGFAQVARRSQLSGSTFTLTRETEIMVVSKIPCALAGAGVGRGKRDDKQRSKGAKKMDLQVLS